MTRSLFVVAGLALAIGFCTAVPVGAETAMQQCGQQYQAAKAAGTLNGMTWNQFRTDCSAKLKAQPASTSAPAAPAANPLNPAPAAPAPAAPAPAAPAPSTTAAAPAAPKPAATGGRAAMLSRERQCGSEWRATKASLVAATPSLTWPKYWSQCNTRLKSAGQ